MKHNLICMALAMLTMGYGIGFVVVVNLLTACLIEDMAIRSGIALLSLLITPFATIQFANKLVDITEEYVI
jgi:hypothetical protein